MVHVPGIITESVGVMPVDKQTIATNLRDKVISAIIERPAILRTVLKVYGTITARK